MWNGDDKFLIEILNKVFLAFPAYIILISDKKLVNVSIIIIIHFFLN